MSTLTEVIPLEGIDLEGSPPCAAVMDKSGRACGRPGETRVTTNCCGCPNTVSEFFCVPCWTYLRLFIMYQEWACKYCGSHVKIREG